MTASLTVEDLAVLKVPKLVMTTGRTLEPQRPSLLGQMLRSRFVCKELLLEIQQASLFVRFRHGEYLLAT